MQDLSHFFRLELRLLDLLSTHQEPFSHGTVYLDEEYPDRFVSNLLVVDGSRDEVEPSELIETADRILGGAGFAHRAIRVHNGALGEVLAPALADVGYLAERDVVMLHAHPPDRSSEVAAYEVSFDDVKSLVAAVYRSQPWAQEEGIADRFTDQHGKYERVIGARFFVASIEGRQAGKCELYIDGDDAQVEDVDTLEEFRGRGVARAVVLAAVDAARAAGASRVFIVADEDDWPKDLYARLGFDRIGTLWQFIRWPEGTPPPS